MKLPRGLDEYEGVVIAWNQTVHLDKGDGTPRCGQASIDYNHAGHEQVVNCKKCVRLYAVDEKRARRRTP